MHQRTMILATLTIVVVFVEILFLQGYNNNTQAQIIDYSVPNKKIEMEFQNENLSLSTLNSSHGHKVIIINDPSSTDSTEESSSASSEGDQAAPSPNVSTNNPPALVPPPTSNVDGVNVAKKPDFELDFGKIPNGTAVSSLFRIQNGIDDDWSPDWNNEKQMYKPQNVKIENGNLVLQAKVESTGEITSGKVDLKGFFAATYGTFEVVAKLPSGIGTFPAIWMLPSDGSYFRDNIATPQEKTSDLSWQGGGEIDIIEFLGVEPGSVFHDLHSYSTLISNSDKYSSETRAANLSSQFHTYGISWDPNSVTFAVDGISTHKVTKPSDNFRDWPFSKPFYLILNLAMGGTWNDDLVADLGKSYPKGINNADQANWNFYIKNIRHYPL